MSRLGQSLVLGSAAALVGIVLGLLAAVFHLEEMVGLDLLFRMRGPRAPPSDVVVISIDRASADALALPPEPARWPRAPHARLVDHLTRQGAAVIVFDVVFERPGPSEEDQLFADAIRRAGNVVLAEYLTRETVAVPGQPGGAGGALLIEQPVPPIAPLAEAALGLAPFPLPKVPIKVGQYWTFRTDAGDTPTLPVVAFQAFALDVYGPFRRLLEQVSPGHARGLPVSRGGLLAGGRLQQRVHGIRDLFLREPGLGHALVARLRVAPPEDLDAAQRRTLAGLVELYRGPASRHLNFYGPPGSVTTIPYHLALPPEPGVSRPSPPVGVAGKAVFVGLADSGQSQQKDGFYTVYSQPNGLDLSGVEIAATAFANLLTSLPVEPVGPSWHLATILAWGLATGMTARLLPPAVAVPTLLGAGLLYLLVARAQFGSAARWYPLVTPLGLQLPVAILGAMVWSHVETRRERTNVRRALAYYLPPKIADRIARDLGEIRGESTLLHGTCLSTDAHQYTALAETMSPAELGAFMNRYYAAIFEPVKRHGGIVQDVVGDSMLAVWAIEREDAALRRQACLAALDIARAVDRFNREAAQTPLPTRIGLHSGQLLLGNVGAIDHYEYRAVGDIVNTATRLENLNKYTGTQILASAEVLEALEGFLTRALGRFLLIGKSKPVDVAELVCLASDATPDQLRRCAAFAEALAAYRDRSWPRARERLQACLAGGTEDGPARFYLGLCERYAQQGPAEPWDGVVRMDRK